jgi:hypothetical protein
MISSMRTRHRIMFVSAGLLLCVGVILWMRRERGWQPVMQPSLQPVTSTSPRNELVGLTEPAVRSRLGEPRSEFAGHYGLPPKSFVDKFSRQIKTSVFRTATGDEYVSFEKRQDSWVVICNQSVPAGAAF